MAQFYFLSVLFNIIAGLILIYGKDLTQSDSTNLILSDDEKSKKSSTSKKLNDFVSEENFTDEEKSEKTSAKKSKLSSKVQNKKSVENEKAFDFLNNNTLRLICGVLCVFVGIMKFLSVFRNDVPVIGDLIPAIAGLVGGVSLLLEYYLTHATTSSEIPSWVDKFFIESRKYLGIFCLLAGLLHFVFPQVVLL